MLVAEQDLAAQLQQADQRVQGAFRRPVDDIADDAPVTAVEPHRLNGVDVPAELYERTDPDPFFQPTSTERIRRELGCRPLYPGVCAARDAGAR